MAETMMYVTSGKPFLCDAGSGGMYDKATKRSKFHPQRRHIEVVVVVGGGGGGGGGGVTAGDTTTLSWAPLHNMQVTHSLAMKEAERELVWKMTDGVRRLQDNWPYLS